MFGTINTLMPYSGNFSFKCSIAVLIPENDPPVKQILNKGNFA